MSNDYDDDDIAEAFRYGDTSEFWWCAPEESIAARAFERAKKIVDANTSVYAMMREYVRMYDGRDPIWYDESGLVDVSAVAAAMNRVSLPTGANPKQNLFATVIDAMQSIVAKQRPLPRAMTHGGDWASHRVCRALNNAIKGVVPDSGIYEAGPELVTDALVCGTGVLRFYEDKKGSHCKRLVPWQLVVDQELCVDGDMPDEVFVRSMENVRSLAAKYKDKREQIMEAKRLSQTGRGSQVIVYEGWYMGDDEAIYVKFMEGVLLECEDWTGRRLPIEYCHFQKPRTGFYGIGLAEKLLGQQIRIDEIESFIAEMQRRHMRPTAFVAQGAGLSKVVAVDGLEMDVIETPGGQPPTIHVPSPVHPDLYRQIDRIVDRSMQETGVSNFSTNSQLPSGIESGPAVREVAFKNLDRHNQFAMKYEALFIAAGHHVIDAHCRIARSKRGKHTVFYKSKGGLSAVDWPEELTSEKLKYVLSVESSSLETLSPAFRTQTVLEWSQMGLLNGPGEVRQLMGNPDLEESDRYSMAAHEDEALFIIDELSKGERVIPDPYMDLAVIVPKVQAAMSVARQMKIPETDPDIYTAFTMFVDEALVIQSNRMQPATDEGMPIPSVSRASAQGLDVPLSGGGQSSQGI